MRVHRRNFEGNSAPAEWPGLELVVSDAATQWLRVEAAPPSMLRLVDGPRTMLWAVVRTRDYCGVHCRHGAWTSVLPPLRRLDAPRHDDQSDRLSGWAHRFVDLLSHDRSVLSNGRWTMRPMRLLQAGARAPLGSAGDLSIAVVDHELLDEGDDLYIDWFQSGPPAVVPLRRMSGSDSGRVKAYRKLYSDGTLPPVLLWWIGGLNAWVVLDGHDRLQAALSVGDLSKLHVLGLDETLHPDEVRERGLVGAEAAFEEKMALPGATTNQPMMRAFELTLMREQPAAQHWPKTRAHALPGLRDAWRDDVRANAPDWLHSLENHGVIQKV